MRLPVRSLLAVLLIVLPFATTRSALADIVRLKSGGRCEGTIVEETDTMVRIRVGGGHITVPKSEVREIIRDPIAKGAPHPMSPAPLPATAPLPPIAVPRLAPPPGSVSLHDALARRLITAEANGKSLDAVTLHLAVTGGRGLRVFVPAGTYLVPKVRNNDTNPPQDMVVTRSMIVDLGREAQSVSVRAACARWARRVPDAADVLEIQPATAHPDLVRLAAFLEEAGADKATSQAAVWIATNDTDYDGLGRMGVRSYYARHLSPTGAPGGGFSRSIREAEAVAGMMLCRRSGIRIEEKKIYRDRFLLVWALTDPNLASWALDRLRAQGHGNTIDDVVIAILHDGRAPDGTPASPRLIRECCRVVIERPIAAALPTLRRNLEDTARSRRRERHLQAKTFVRLVLHHGNVREAVEHLVWLSGAPDVESTVVDALEDAAFSERVWLTAERRQIGDALLRLLHDGRSVHPSTLRVALLRWEDALDPARLLAASSSPQPAVRKMASSILVRRGDGESLNAVLGRVEESPDLLLTLAERDDARPHLLRFATAEDVQVRRLAIQAIGSMSPGPDAERVLRACLQDPDASIRVAAVQSLGRGRYRGAAPSIRRRLFEDADEHVRRRAGRALVDILGADAYDDLRRASKRAKTDAEERDLSLTAKLALTLRRTPSGGR